MDHLFHTGLSLVLVSSKSQQEDSSGQQEQDQPFCFKLSLLAAVGRPVSPYARLQDKLKTVSSHPVSLFFLTSLTPNIQ